MKTQVWKKLSLWLMAMSLAFVLALPVATRGLSDGSRYVLTDPGGGHGGG